MHEVAIMLAGVLMVAAGAYVIGVRSATISRSPSMVVEEETSLDGIGDLSGLEINRISVWSGLGADEDGNPVDAMVVEFNRTNGPAVVVLTTEQVAGIWETFGRWLKAVYTREEER